MRMTTPQRARGIALMLGAGVCWSSGGLIVRLVSIRDPWEIVFWRALFMALFVALLLGLAHGRTLPAQVRAVGATGVVAAICLAAQICLFILALKHTSTANTFVLMSISPLATAMFGRIFLSEPVAMSTWVAIAVALAGIGVMFGDGFGAGFGDPAGGTRWLGNIFALCVPFAYATQILFVRRMQRPGHPVPNLMPTILIAGAIAAVPGFALAASFEATAKDIGLLAMMGCVQLGLGCYLMTLAVPHLRAAEMGLLALVETVLAPFWVWIGVGEVPRPSALAGGAMIVGALLVNGMFALRQPART